ncbi:platelet endothelial cell adhesion molecule isoform X2 [Salminus brasiliensis]|uniref:platelet endothelial cell adhesion molecule isoform X2 n=1 Tax=Salminus brasiliensis TaxID=930266 RepID=UPI003B832080
MRATRTCLFLLLFTCTKGQPVFFVKDATLSVQPALKVERGTNLTLTCTAQVSHASGHIPPHSYNFYKDFHNANNMQPLEARGKETLHISQARAFHSGRYQCEVVVEGQKTKSSFQEVEVKGLQTPELIVDKLRVKEGENVSAVCKAEEEKGLLTFTFRDGSNVVYLAKTDSGQAQTYILFHSGRTADLTCSYVIKLESKILHSNSSNVVSVEVQELSITPTITITPSTEVFEADTVNFLCQVGSDYQSSPSLSLLLVKGTKILQQNMKTGQYTKKVQAADSGEYECYAIMNKILKTTSANLTVKELFSQPELAIRPTNVFEREQFTVTCESLEFASERIQSSDVKYYIYRNEHHVTLGAFDGKLVATAGSESNGNYTCKAEARNIIKWSQAQIFSARVLVSRPIIQVVGQVVGQVVLGRPFLIHCFSENGSFPITYTLKRNHNLLNRSESRHPHEHAIFTANISSENQIQEFRCEAKNSPHPPLMSEALSASVIVPVGLVFLTIIPTPEDVTEGHDVVLICKVSRGTPPVSFRWYRSDSNIPLLSTTTMANFSLHTLHKVSSEDNGSYHCEAFNSGTDFTRSNKVTFTVGVLSGEASVWSKRPPDTGDAGDVEDPEETNVEYTEVLHPQADPARVPLKKGTDTVYSELQTPQQGLGEVF